MINLEQLASNEFVIYANTIDNDVQEFGDYFLIGFRSGFTREWSYVIPFVLVRNTRFLKFQIELVANISIEDPTNGEVYLTPSGNWDYKIWNTDYATLDPSIGTLIDSGQMILADQAPPEVIFETFVSANEDLQSVIFVPAISSALSRCVGESVTKSDGKSNPIMSCQNDLGSKLVKKLPVVVFVY